MKQWHSTRVIPRYLCLSTICVSNKNVLRSFHMWNTRENFSPLKSGIICGQNINPLWQVDDSISSRRFCEVRCQFLCSTTALVTCPDSQLTVTCGRQPRDLRDIVSDSINLRHIVKIKVLFTTFVWHFPASFHHKESDRRLSITILHHLWK